MTRLPPLEPPTPAEELGIQKVPRYPVSGSTIIAAVVALGGIGAGSAVALSVFGSGSSTPAVLAVFGFLGTSITALIALLKLDRVQRALNGQMARHAELARDVGRLEGELRRDIPPESSQEPRGGRETPAEP